MIRGTDGIRDAYRSDKVAQTYVDQRFTAPLGALLHDRQVHVVRKHIGGKPACVLEEVAPGPARVTKDVAPGYAGRGIIMDTSAQMLAEARRRMSETRAWQAIQGDVFSLPFQRQFDLVYSFRLIRHFEAKGRADIYRQIGSILKPGGYLIFDAVNKVVSAPLRAAAAAGEYEHYDALLTPAEITTELGKAGFAVESLTGVQHRYNVLRQLQFLVAPRSRGLARHLMNAVDSAGGGQPLEWVVTCRRA